MSFSICLLSDIKSFFSLVAREVKMNYATEEGRPTSTPSRTQKDFNYPNA